MGSTATARLSKLGACLLAGSLITLLLVPMMPGAVMAQGKPQRPVSPELPDFQEEYEAFRGSAFTAVNPLLRFANALHVAPGGDDANDGSAGAPWATLQHAAEQVQPGDTVFVHDGTYAGFQIEQGGVAGQPVVFLALGTEVIVNAVNPVFGRDNINVEGADYVVIEGFHVRDAAAVVVVAGVAPDDGIVGGYVAIGDVDAVLVL